MLSNCYIAKGSLTNISKYIKIKNNPNSLITLDVSWNSIEYENIKYFSECLSYLKSLKNLNLCYNNIGIHGVKNTLWDKK